MRPPTAPLPVLIVTGFLGAGKTTLINRFLADPAFSDTAVVVNEFGAIDIDGELVRTGSGDLLVSSTGCLCCTAASDIRATLFDLLETARTRLSRGFSRVLVETTGLADPAPVINMLTPGALPALGLRDHTVARRFHLAGIVTLVDAVTGDLAIDRQLEAVKQIAFADRILITKTDLVEDPASRRDLDALRIRVAHINPAASVVTDPRDLDLDDLFRRRFVPDRFGEDADGWLAIDRLNRGSPTVAGFQPTRPSSHDGDISTVVLRHAGPLGRAEVDLFLTLLQNTAGAEVLRVKGLVELSDDPDRPAVIHMVRHLVHPLTRLDSWPGPDRTGRLVIIGRGLAKDRLQTLFDALVARPLPRSSASTADRLPLTFAAIAVLLTLAAVILTPFHPSPADPGEGYGRFPMEKKP